MREPSWTDGGATVPTIVATLISLMSAPVGALGLIFAAFGGWIPALALSSAGIVMWVGGRWLIER